MQNEPNFGKAQMNVNKVLTKDYEKISDWTLGQNEPKTNPIKANSNLIKANSNLIKANIMPKQTQFKAKQSLFQSQYNAALHLFAVGCRTEKIMLFKSLSGKCRLKIMFALYPKIW